MSISYGALNSANNVDDVEADKGGRAERVDALMRRHYERGWFRGLAPLSIGVTESTYAVVWHRQRRIDLVINFDQCRIEALEILPGVSIDSEMFLDAKAFLENMQRDDIWSHRRVSPDKFQLDVWAAGEGGLSVALQANDDDIEEVILKFLQIVHELFQDFLANGPYYEYQIEHLGVNPDALSYG